jgi:hypothetical protein
MTFPVPKDVRAARDFEIIRGGDEMLRQDLLVVDTAVRFDPGEWVKPAASGGVTKAAKVVVADDIDAPALGAKVCWTLRIPGGDGQSDTLATGAITVLSGTYQAKTTFYNTGGTFAPGYLLVVVFDAAEDRGYLDAPDPATMDARQLQGVVGRVIEVASGVLHYEAPGL